MKNAVVWPICLPCWKQITLQIVSQVAEAKKSVIKTSVVKHNWKLKGLSNCASTQFQRGRLGESCSADSHLQIAICIKIKTTGTCS